ncbi:MAG: hypothetical protein Q8L48_37920 [Archangium sp.]|nr:hypothetical protein [Archangium sp.]
MLTTLLLSLLTASGADEVKTLCALTPGSREELHAQLEFLRPTLTTNDAKFIVHRLRTLPAADVGPFLEQQRKVVALDACPLSALVSGLPAIDPLTRCGEAACTPAALDAATIVALERRMDLETRLIIIKPKTPLGGLRASKRLRQLRLEGDGTAVDLRPLLETALERITVLQVPLVDLSVFALPTLRSLRWEGQLGGDADVGALAKGGKLETLSLRTYGRHRFELEGLEQSASTLTTLELAGAELVHPEGISKLTSLKVVQLPLRADPKRPGPPPGAKFMFSTPLPEGCPVKLLAPLKQLERVKLSGCAVTTLAPLANATGLVKLELDWNTALSDLTPLAAMTKLEELTLSHTAVVDVTALEGLPKLRSLRVPKGAKVEKLRAARPGLQLAQD